jgi:hypothetical protein
MNTASNMADEETCDECHGTGQVSYERSGQDSDGNAPIIERCPMCGYGEPKWDCKCGESTCVYCAQRALAKAGV